MQDKPMANALNRLGPMDGSYLGIKFIAQHLGTDRQQAS